MLILVLPNVNYTTTKTGYYKILKEMIAALFRICTSRACSRRITVPSLDWCDCMASSTQSLQDYFFAVMLHLANWHCCSPTPAPATHWQIFHMAGVNNNIRCCQPDYPEVNKLFDVYLQRCVFVFQASVHENIILSLAMVMLYPLCICMCVLCHLNNKSLITASIFF